MQEPPTIAWLLAALATVLGIYCLARCRSKQALTREEQLLDASAALMGLTMAIMVICAQRGLDVPALFWLLVLAPAAGRSLAAVWRSHSHRRHHAEHALGHLAMLYMAFAMAAPMRSMDRKPHMSQSTGLPWLTGTLILIFTFDAVLAGTRLLRPAPAAAAGHPHTGGQRLRWAPRMPDACHAALSLGMTIMLIGL